MYDQGLIVAREEREPGYLPEVDGRLVLHLELPVEPVEMEVAEHVDPCVWLHGTVELGHVHRVRAARVSVEVLIGTHLCGSF